MKLNVDKEDLDQLAQIKIFKLYAKISLLIKLEINHMKRPVRFLRCSVSVLQCIYKYLNLCLF